MGPPELRTDEVVGDRNGMVAVLVSKAPKSGALAAISSVILGSTTPASRPADPARRLKSRPSGLSARCGYSGSGLTRSPRPRSPPIRSADPVPSPPVGAPKAEGRHGASTEPQDLGPILNKLSLPIGARLAECASVWKRRPAATYPAEAGTYLGRRTKS